MHTHTKKKEREKHEFFLTLDYPPQKSIFFFFFGEKGYGGKSCKCIGGFCGRERQERDGGGDKNNRF